MATDPVDKEEWDNIDRVDSVTGSVVVMAVKSGGSRASLLSF